MHVGGGAVAQASRLAAAHPALPALCGETGVGLGRDAGACMSSWRGNAAAILCARQGRQPAGTAVPGPGHAALLGGCASTGWQ